MVAGMVTASYKKSCSDYLNRNNEIRRSADKILKIYLGLEEDHRFVTAETVQPRVPLITSKSRHYIIPGHCDPFVHLGVALHPLVKCLRNYLKKKNTVMSIYLVYEMIYMGIESIK
jgi:hypothetical protein